MKKFKKEWIKMNDNVETTEEVAEETKEESDMSFFQKHKKGLIFGGLGALAATAAGFFLLKSGSDDEFEDGDYEDLDDADSVASDEETE